MLLSHVTHTTQKIKFSYKLKSLDGTDFRISEPSPFSTKWWSFKFNGTGLPYEIAIDAESGHIVWAYGGNPCGAFPDLIIARKKFVQLLRPGEKVVADRGHKDGRCFVQAKTGSLRHKRRQNMLARHENVNRRVKSFDSLSGAFRHDVSKHHVCFHAVVNIVQIAIETCDERPSLTKQSCKHCFHSTNLVFKSIRKCVS